MITGNPKVTVVMIFLNAEEFMREAIESVIGQSYTGWELILVDDGSSDRSRAVRKSMLGGGLRMCASYNTPTARIAG
jgi:glycosyltransferase involved in cell wall biosynthesis